MSGADPGGIMSGADPGDDLTNDDLLDLHEDILDRNEEGVRSLLAEFINHKLPVRKLCCTEVELEPASHDHPINSLPLAALHRAALIDSHGILDLIISSVPDLDVNLPLQTTGYSALHVSAAAGVLPAVNFLTSSAANVEAVDHSGSTPLCLAAQYGHKDIMSLLCVRGAKISAKSIRDRTPLHSAVDGGHVDAVDFLLGKDAKVNVKDAEGMTPLHLAQVKGHMHITERLLDRNADVMATDNAGNTPIHTWILNMKAKRNVNYNCPSTTSLATLLCRGGNVNAQNLAGNTPLHLSSATGCRPLVEFLVNQRAEINKVNAERRPPIFFSTNEDITETLLKNGASVNLTDSNGNNVLHAYAESDDVTVDMLFDVIEHGANVNEQNLAGQTPLHCACLTGNREKIDLLLSSGARNDALDKNDQGILHLSLHKKNGELAMWLLRKNSINLNQNNNDGDSLLHLAAENGLVDVVEYLCSTNVQISSMNSLGETPATLAAKNNHFSCLETILLRGGAIRQKEGGDALLYFTQCSNTSVVKMLVEQIDSNIVHDNKGNSALHLALARESQDVVQILLDANANISKTDSEGSFPLHIACKNCSKMEHFIPRLITHKICNSADIKSSTPLHYAISTCSLETLQLFLENDFNLNAKNNDRRTVAHCLLYDLVDSSSDSLRYRASDKMASIIEKCHSCLNLVDISGNTVLHLATLAKHIDIMSVILDTDVDVNAQNADGLTPLHLACSLGEQKIGSYLLNCKANPNVLDNKRRSAIFHAVSSENLPLVELLLEMNSDVNQQDLDGKTCIMEASEKHLSNICTQVLLLAEVDLNLSDNRGRSLIHYVAQHCTDEVLDILVEQGAAVNAPDSDENSPLHAACFNDNSSVIASLLKTNINVNTRDSKSETALHVCARLGNYAHAKALITKGADIEITNAAGRTALHLAAAAHDSDVLELLIANEADLDSVDNEGNTPLALSIVNSSMENSWELVEQGADVSIANNVGDTSLHLAMRMESLDRHLLKLLLHKGRPVASVQNNNGDSSIDFLLSRTDIDPYVIAADIGLDL